MTKRLVKSKKDKKIFGVCGGIAEYLNIDVTLIRFVWACAVLFFGTGILGYIIFALIMPDSAE